MNLPQRPIALIVEDERIIAMDLKFKLGKLGLDVLAAVSSGEKAMEQIDKCRPDLILMDIMLEGTLDGVQTARLIQSRDQTIPLIYLTAFTDQTTYNRAMETNPSAFLSKPVELADLRQAVQAAMGRG